VLELELLLVANRWKMGGHGKNLRKRQYHMEIFNLMEQNGILSMQLHRINVEYDFGKPFRVEIPEENLKNATVWYTDVSQMNRITQITETAL
jgi:hypothetical protein